MATEKRLVDAKVLEHTMCRKCNDAYSNEPCEPNDCIFLNAIDETPTVDAVEVVHGRWAAKPVRKLNGKGRVVNYCDCYYCSECGTDRPIVSPYKYCPNCGAKMDGDG